MHKNSVFQIKAAAPGKQISAHLDSKKAAGSYNFRPLAYIHEYSAVSTLNLFIASQVLGTIYQETTSWGSVITSFFIIPLRLTSMKHLCQYVHNTQKMPKTATDYITDNYGTNKNETSQQQKGTCCWEVSLYRIKKLSMNFSCRKSAVVVVSGLFLYIPGAVDGLLKP